MVFKMRMLRHTDKGLEATVPITVSFHKDIRETIAQQYKKHNGFFFYLDSLYFSDMLTQEPSFFTTSIDGICIFKKIFNDINVGYKKKHRNMFQNKTSYYYKIVDYDIDNLKRKVMCVFHYLNLSESNIKIRYKNTFINKIEYKGLPVININITNPKIAKRYLIANTI